MKKIPFFVAVLFFSCIFPACDKKSPTGNNAAETTVTDIDGNVYQ